jgi:membrane protease YdiL (CAAX protease family)
MLFMLLLMGPLAEEFGWRGYALDQLQSKWSALVSNLTLGVFWFVWHFPLFFMIGMLQQELGFGSLAFWAYGAFCLALSILIAWVYNNNGRSILAAILLHFMSNATTTVLGPISDRTNIFAIGILVVAAIVVVLVCGERTLIRGKQHLEEPKFA